MNLLSKLIKIEKEEYVYDVPGVIYNITFPFLPNYQIVFENSTINIYLAIKEEFEPTTKVYDSEDYWRDIFVLIFRKPFIK